MKILNTVLMLALTCSAAWADSVQAILKSYDAKKDGKVFVSASEILGRLKSTDNEYMLVALKNPNMKKMSPLGMKQPIMANFYHGGFIQVSVGKLSTASLTPVLSKGKDHTGADCVEALWKLDGGTITLRFTMLPGSEAVMVEAESSLPLDKKSSFYIRMNVYPQSFNRKKKGAPRANFLYTSTGKKETEAGAKVYGATEAWVYTGDANFKGEVGGAVVGIDKKRVREYRVFLGGYGVRHDLYFHTGHAPRFILVDYGNRKTADPAVDVKPLMEKEMALFKEWVAKKAK
jgi:hypothetical protein